MPRMPVAAALTAALLSTTPVLAADPRASDDVADGRQLFQIYCQGCHGETGRGDGPAAAALTTRPADLTAIAPDPDGSFPRERVFREIEGIEVVPGHRSREMPLWGFSFRELDRDAGREGEVEAKIRKLVAYVETLQARDGAPDSE